MKPYTYPCQHDTRGLTGETVRNAYLLTDSFRPVDTAHAQRYAGKAAMEAARARQDEVGLTDEHRQVIIWLHEWLQQPDRPANLRTEVVAMSLELPTRQTGQLMNGLFGDIDKIKGSNGWKTAGLRQALAVKFGLSGSEAE